MTNDTTAKSDIFISYTKGDRERIAPLVQLLVQEGWRVWWDRKIPPGKTYDDVIEATLNSCGCVIVVWSEKSIKSEWVRDEAGEAKRQRKLIPVMIDQVRPPLEFRRIQAANLLNWEPGTESADFEELMAAICELIGKPASSQESDAEEDKSEAEDDVGDEDELEAEDWFDKGYDAQDREEFDNALRHYSRAIELDPKYADAFKNRGDVYSSLEQYGDALKDFRKAIRLNPDDAETYSNRGEVLGVLGRYKEALKDFGKAIELEPNEAYTYLFRGFVLQDVEHHEEALEDFLRAKEIDASDFFIRQVIADKCIMMGRYEAALDHAEKARNLAEEQEDLSISLYLKCIAEKLLSRDTSGTSSQFEKALQKDFEIDWPFDDIEDWVKTAEIPEDARKFIVEKAEMLKAKQRKKG